MGFAVLERVWGEVMGISSDPGRLRERSRIGAWALGLATAVALGASAHAATIDFNLPAGQTYLGNSYSQGGFTFTNDGNATDAFYNSVALGIPSWNADDTGDITTYFLDSTTTITQDNGNPFDFSSIGLANSVNGDWGGSIDFTFNYDGGGSASQTVVLANATGLQHFSFNEQNLDSVSFHSTGYYDTFQFDDVGVSPSGVASVGGVPEPATWALMLLGFIGLGAVLRFRGGTETTRAVGA